MQYNVPQFIEVEDRIIGPLSLRQFLTLLCGGLVSLVIWRILGVSGIFFLLVLPIAGISAYLAFGTFNGRPIHTLMPHALKYFSTPKVRVFQRTGEKTMVLTKKMKPQEREYMKPEEVSSRLKKLSYLLDQKASEEERLVHSGQLPKKWLNQI